MSKTSKHFHNKLSIIDTTIYDSLSEEQIQELSNMFNINPNIIFSDGYEAFGYITCKTLEEFMSYVFNFDKYSYWSECDYYRNY